MIAFPIGLGVFYKDFLETDVLWKHRNIQVISFGVIWGHVRAERKIIVYLNETFSSSVIFLRDKSTKYTFFDMMS